jgi:hypothetical protein
VATIGARLLSGAFNFSLEYFLVFENQGGFAKKMGRYALIFFLNMGLSFGLTYAFNYLPGESHLHQVRRRLRSLRRQLLRGSRLGLR